MSNVEAIKKALEVADTLREYTDIDANEGANRDVVAASYAACDAITELSTTLEALQRENEQLRKDRDELQEEANELVVAQYTISARDAEISRLMKALKSLVSDLENRSTGGTVNCSHGVYMTAKEALASAGEEHHAE